MKLDLIEAGTPKLYATAMSGHGRQHFYGGVTKAVREGVYAVPCLVLAKGKYRFQLNACRERTIVPVDFVGTPTSVVIAYPLGYCGRWDGDATNPGPYHFSLTDVWPRISELKWPWGFDIVSPAKIWDWDEFQAKRDDRVEVARELGAQRERLNVVGREAMDKFQAELRSILDADHGPVASMVRREQEFHVSTFNDGHSFNFRLDMDINATDLSPELVSLFKERAALTKRLEECGIRFR